MQIRTTGNPYPYQPLPSESWRDSLGRLSPSDLPDEFNALVRKFVQNPKAIPTEAELNTLICECMFLGKVKPLRNMLTQAPLQTLHITRHVTKGAWQTLLDAMPPSCSITQLIVSGQASAQKQELDRANTTLLFKIMGRMPDLECVRINACAVTFWALLDPPSCPPLLELRHLHVEKTENPYLVLLAILDASPKLSGVHLHSITDMDDEKHDFLAMFLSKRHAFTLHELTLSALQDEKCVVAYIPLLKKTTALTRLNFSRNKLSSLTCERLHEALQDKTALTHLSLAGCWPDVGEEFDWKQVAELVKLKSLVGLDLSGNRATCPMTPVLAAIAAHPGLQHVNLNVLDVRTSFVVGLGFDVLRDNKTLISLQLPALPDDKCEVLVKGMTTNRSLRYLCIADIERKRPQMAEEDFYRIYKNYLVLMACVERNAFPFVAEGMKVLLGHMGRTDPAHDPLREVPADIVHYAAQWSMKRNGSQTKELSGVTRSASPKK